MADPMATPLQLLQELGTNDVVHDRRKGNRNLMSHLVGTQELLRAGGYCDSVCHAGLLHSIYGTNRFQIMSIDPTAPGSRDRV